jgi:hypothetical protein
MIEDSLWKLIAYKKPSIVFLLSGMFRHTEKTTMKADRELFGIVTDHLQNWIDPILVLIRRYPLKKWGIVGFTFGELFADLNLVVFSIVGGAYFNAARTMRSVFEYMANAAYLAEKFPEYPGLIFDTMQQGISGDKFDRVIRERLAEEFDFAKEQLDEMTGFKVRMIRYLNFATNEEKVHLCETYSHLSRLTHPSPSQLGKYSEDAYRGVTFFYDPPFFQECAGLFDEVMDLVLSVLLTAFADIKHDLKSQKYAYESLARLPMAFRLLA